MTVVANPVVTGIEVGDIVADGSLPFSGTVTFEAGLKLNNTQALSSLDASGSNTANLVTLDGSDDLFIGDSTHVDNMVFDVTTAGTFSFDVNGVPVFTIATDGKGVFSGQVDADWFTPTVTSTLTASSNTLYFKNRIKIASSADFEIQLENLSADSATSDLNLTAQAAKSDASTNLDGGAVNVTGGNGASGSGSDADGGPVVLRGGTGFGTGVNGGIDIGGASDLLGVLGTTPIAKQTGVAVSDAAIHAALVAIGFFSGP